MNLFSPSDYVFVNTRTQVKSIGVDLEGNRTKTGGTPDNRPDVRRKAPKCPILLRKTK